MNKFENIRGKKIFLVEDDKFLTKIIANQMQQAGCIFNNSENGTDAVSAIEKDKPDVILLDLMFPGGLDGFAVLEKIKKNENTKNIPVVILSNLSEPKDIEKGMSLGAFRFIVKASIVPEEILEHVSSALDSSIR